MSFDEQSNSQAASDLLIDTSGALGDFGVQPVAQHAHQQFALQQAPLMPTTAGIVPAISSQPTSNATNAKIAPESQTMTYSIHPAFAALDSIDALLVKQRVDCERTCCGFESTNSYVVRTAGNEPVLRAVEQSNCLERCFCEQNRRYELNFAVGEEIVARVVKPHRVSRLCCYSNAVSVESPADNPIGSIKQRFTLFGHSKFAVFDAQYSAQRPVFVIESMSCRFCCNALLSTCCCVNRAFEVLSVANDIVQAPQQQDNSSSSDDTGEAGSQRKSAGRRQVALIARDVSALVGVCGNADASWTNASTNNTNTNTDQAANQSSTADTKDSFEQAQESQPLADQQQVRLNTKTCPAFGIQFSANIEPRHKVLLLAACFMIDFYYFDADRRRNKLLAC